MNTRILIALFVLTSVASASALQIIGAIDQNANAYDRYAMDQILTLSRQAFGDAAVSSRIMTPDAVTNQDLQENIVVIVKDGRTIISAPPGSAADAYLSELRTYAGDYLPFDVMDSSTVIDTGVSAQFDQTCVETDSGNIYERGIATGYLEGATLSADYEDLCIGNTLVEYTCANDTVVKQQYDCSDGCSKGACSRGSSDGGSANCPTRWLWTVNGYICERIGENTTNETTIVTPETCPGGCVSGERCVPIGTIMPDKRRCESNGGIICPGCDIGRECVPEGATSKDGRVCTDGALVAPPPAPEPTPVPMPSEQNSTPPVPEPIGGPIPQRTATHDGLWHRIAAFFANLFGRS